MSTLERHAKAAVRILDFNNSQPLAYTDARVMRGPTCGALYPHLRDPFEDFERATGGDWRGVLHDSGTIARSRAGVKPCLDLFVRHLYRVLCALSSCIRDGPGALVRSVDQPRCLESPGCGFEAWRAR